jgi:hypothetical protein
MSFCKINLIGIQERIVEHPMAELRLNIKSDYDESKFDREIAINTPFDTDTSTRGGTVLAYAESRGETSRLQGGLTS